MKIVIEISKLTYEEINRYGLALSPRGGRELEKALKSGTPLPERHGRLIDADALIDSLGASDRDIYCKAVIEEDAPTIIEGSESK